MNWKQFLKPDWKKIIIFLVLICYFYFMLNSPSTYCVGAGIPPKIVCSSNIEMIRQSTFSFFEYSQHPSYFDLTLEKQKTYNLIINLGLLVLLPLVSYILSCLIVWIYDNFRKKK